MLELRQRTVNSLRAYYWSAGYMRAASLRRLGEVLDRPDAQAQLYSPHRRRSFQGSRNWSDVARGSSAGCVVAPAGLSGPYDAADARAQPAKPAAMAAASKIWLLHPQRRGRAGRPPAPATIPASRPWRLRPAGLPHRRRRRPRLEGHRRCRCLRLDGHRCCRCLWLDGHRRCRCPWLDGHRRCRRPREHPGRC